MNKFYTGCVEDRNDPLKLGRCQVRIVGLHTEDKTILPTADLPWAFPVTPITSAGVSGIGTTPIGPVEGSWVLIMFMDPDQQLPIMMGTLGGIAQIANAKDDSKTIQVDSVSPDGTVNQSPGDPEATGGKQPTNLQDGNLVKPDEIVGPLAKLIASGESGSAGYDAFNRGSGAPKGTGSVGGQKLSLTDMTIKEIMDKQSLQPGDPNRLFAVGKYQCIPSTLKDACQKLNIDVNQRFSPYTQDLICQEYLVARKRPRLLAYYRNPNKNNETLLKEAGKALAAEFASIEDPFNLKFPYGGETGTYYKNGNRVKTSWDTIKENLISEWEFRNNPQAPPVTTEIANGDKFAAKGTDYNGVQKLLPKDDSKKSKPTESAGDGLIGDIVGAIAGDIIPGGGEDLFGGGLGGLLDGIDLGSLPDLGDLGLDFQGLADLGLGDLADLGLGDLGDLGDLGGLLGDMGLSGLGNLGPDLVSNITELQGQITDLTKSIGLDSPLDGILGKTANGGFNLNGMLTDAGFNVQGIDVNGLVAKTTGINVNNLNVNSLVSQATGVNLNNFTGGLNVNNLIGQYTNGDSLNINNIIGQATQGLNVNNLIGQAVNASGVNSLLGQVTGNGLNLNSILGQSTGLNPNNLLGQFGSSLNQITSSLGISNLSGSVTGLVSNLGLTSFSSNALMAELTKIAGSTPGQAKAIVSNLQNEPTIQLPEVIGEQKADGTISTGSNVDPNRGFQDPNGRYPRYKNEQDTNRLASGNNLGRTIVLEKEAALKTAVPIANGGTWDQSPVPYNAVYPYNKVTQTESGHVTEFDDTPGSERIHFYHKSGTFTETDANGTQVNRIVGDGFEIIERNGFVYVQGALNVTVDGAMNLRTDNIFNLEVSGAANINIYNDANVNVSGNANMAVGGVYNLKAHQINMESDGQFNIKAGSGLNIESDSDLNIYSGGTIYNEADSDINLKSVGAIFTETDSDVYIKAGGLVNIESDESTNINGGMKVNVTAGTNLNLKASVFATLSSLAAVDIKATGFVNVDGAIINLNNGIATGAGSAKGAKGAKGAKLAANADIDLPIETRGTSGVSFLPPLNVVTRGSETHFETDDKSSGKDDLATYRSNRVANNESSATGITSNKYIKDTYQPKGTSSGSINSNVSGILDMSPNAFNAGMRLSKNWTLGELTKGGTRIPRTTYVVPSVKGGPRDMKLTPQDIVANLKILCDTVLEPITEKYGKDSFVITSCFRRCSNGPNDPGDLALKDASGNYIPEHGDHVKGSAVDITFKEGKAKTFAVCKELPEVLTTWNQIIMEYDKGGSAYWIHASAKQQGNNGHCFSMNNHKICVAGLNSGFVLL